MSMLQAALLGSFPILLTSPPLAAAGDGLVCHDLEQVLDDPDPVSGECYGSSVSIRGDTALVGAHRDDDGFGNRVGAVHVFVRDGAGWAQQTRLLAGDAAPQDDFGVSVSLSGETALVGARYDDDSGSASGSAYVFVRNGTVWTQQAKLLADDGVAGDNFGSAVALDGDLAVVSARNGGGHGTSDTGAVYVFRRDGTSWTQEAVIDPGTLQDLQFGTSIALSGDTLLVGSHHDHEESPLAGSASVYVRAGGAWPLQTKLFSGEDSAHYEFGRAVALSGDLAVVGAPGDNDFGVDSGSAFVFARQGTSWSKTAKLVDQDSETGDRFGMFVAIDGATALVMRMNDLSGESATAFARHGSSWIPFAVLRPSPPGPIVPIGWPVSVSGDTVLIGCFVTAFGSAHVFALAPPAGTVYCTCPVGPCSNPDPGAGCANSTGAGALLAARGTTQPDELNLFVSGARPGQFGMFFQGETAVALPFGDGFRCAGGAVVRLHPLPVLADAEGAVPFGPCFGDPTVSSVTGVVPGSGTTRRYQYWYRDPGSPCGSNFNLSNGCEVVW